MSADSARLLRLYANSKHVDADSILGKAVDDAEIGDGKVLVYSGVKDKILYKRMRGGGGGQASPSGTKGSDTCPYDADNNEIIDNSERLEGKTLAEVQEGLIPSNPPEGKKKVTNIYWDPVTQELVFEYEE